MAGLDPASFVLGVLVGALAVLVLGGVR